MVACDIFAAALESAPVDVVEDVAHMQRAVVPSHVIANVSKPAVSDTSRSSKKELILARPKKQRSPAMKTQALSQIAHDPDPTKNEYLTLFIDVTAPTNVTSLESSRTPQFTPVCVWPQYELKSHVGVRFIIVNAAEDWFSKLVSVVHAQFINVTHAVKLRELRQNTMDALKKMLINGLSSASAAACAMLDDDDSDGGAASIVTPCAKKRRYSGLPASKVSTIEATLVDCDLTLLNYGKQFVMRLDKEAIRFTTEHVVALIRQLAVKPSHDPEETPALSDVSQRAAYAFVDATPNIRDKITWDPVGELWRLRVFDGKKHACRFTDETGKSLNVMVDSRHADWTAAKKEAYGRAIMAWNILDRSRRYRISEPRSIAIPVLSSDSQSGSQSTDPPCDADVGLMSVVDKWQHDAKL